MPTYEYHCRKCGNKFSQFQKITEPVLKNCPKCQGKNCVERLISGGSGLIFKGSGFYITDYKNKSSTGEKKSEKGGENKQGASDNTP